MPDRQWIADASPVRRTSFRALRALSRAAKFLSRACDWFATGFLTAADLRAARDYEWRSFNTTDDEVDSGLQPWERHFYAACLAQGDRVLLIGCGAGRDLIALAAAGLLVDGLESSPALVADAHRHLRRRGIDASVNVGAIEDAPPPAGYDAYVFSYFCYSYIRGVDARVRALAAIGRVAPDARVLISAPALVIRSRGVTLTNLAATLTQTDWRAERGDVFSMHAEAVHYCHTFGEGEIADEIRKAGFRISRTMNESGMLLIEATPVASARPPRSSPR